MSLVLQEQYSSFKQKFENLDQELAKKDDERRSQAQKEIQGAGVENLSQAKTLFEQLQNENGGGNKGDRKIEIERSDADRKRVKEKFFEVSWKFVFSM